MELKKATYQKKIQLGFSSKIKVPQLGSEPSCLGLARAGNFRLGLITNRHVAASWKHAFNNKKIMSPEINLFQWQFWTWRSKLSIIRNHSVDFNQSCVVISFRRHTHANVRPSGTYGDRGIFVPTYFLQVQYLLGQAIGPLWGICAPISISVEL